MRRIVYVLPLLFILLVICGNCKKPIDDITGTWRPDVMAIRKDHLFQEMVKENREIMEQQLLQMRDTISFIYQKEKLIIERKHKEKPVTKKVIKILSASKDEKGHLILEMDAGNGKKNRIEIIFLDQNHFRIIKEKNSAENSPFVYFERKREL